MQIKQAIEALTNGECRVLAACIEASGDNGFDFTFGDEVFVEGMSSKAVAGTLGSLFAKGVIGGERPVINGAKLAATQIDFYGGPFELVHDGDADAIETLLAALKCFKTDPADADPRLPPSELALEIARALFQLAAGHRAFDVDAQATVDEIADNTPARLIESARMVDTLIDAKDDALAPLRAQNAALVAALKTAIPALEHAYPTIRSPAQVAGTGIEHPAVEIARATIAKAEGGVS